MLTLTRRPTETVLIGNSVSITVLDIKGSRVRLGVKAPHDVVVRRAESVKKSSEEHRIPDAGP